jgi:hypothetical protein
MFITDAPGPNGTRITNYMGTLTQAFSCIAQLGNLGCGFERPYDSIEAALNKTNPQNAGFLRDDAFLLVLIISDEDDDVSVFPDGILDNPNGVQLFSTDPALSGQNGTLGPIASFRGTEFGRIKCSNGTVSPNRNTVMGPYADCTSVGGTSLYASDVQSYADFLTGLKADPSLVYAAVIAGDANNFSVGPNTGGEQGTNWLVPTCAVPAGCNATTGMGGNCTTVAWPGVRHRDFVNAFGARGTFASLCDPDLTGSMAQVANLFSSAIRNPCVTGDVALPLDCTVSYVLHPGTSNQQETPIPECAMMGNQPIPPSDGSTCWWGKPDPTCVNAPNMSIDLVQPNTPAAAHLIANCVAQ